MMKAICGVLFLGAAIAGAAEISPALKSLQGKWTGERSNNEGRTAKVSLEIKDDKLTFKSMDSDGTLRLFAKGTVKIEKAGDLRILIATDLRAGRSEDNLEPVDDDRASVYILREGKLYLGSGFDKARDNERPRVDEYTKQEGSASAAVEKPKSDKLLGKWKLELAMGARNMDYELRFEPLAGGLQAIVVSPRSGEHKAKSVSLKGDAFEMAIDREIEGNAVTFVYKGNLKADALSGTFLVKGYEDQFTGNWKATR
jgi:hypothetical protein